MKLEIPFTKMVAAGNDFIIVDTRRRKLAALTTRWALVAKAMCDRRDGVGADGLLVLAPSKSAEVRMRVFNPDGSEAEMCGNGARCIALYVSNHQKPEQRVTIQTKAGAVSATVQGSQVSMWMPEPKIMHAEKTLKLNGTLYSLCVLDTGVPHAVVFVSDLKEVDVQGIGQQIRHHRVFQPNGTNVDFVRLQDDTSIALRTYERGVESETPACGTGAVAAAVASVVLGRVRGRERALPDVLLPVLLQLKPSERVLEEKARRYLQEHGYKNIPPRYRRTAVEVHTKSGDILNVSFNWCFGRPLDRSEHVTDALFERLFVTDVVLDGSAQRIYQGAFSWQTGVRP